MIVKSISALTASILSECLTLASRANVALCKLQNQNGLPSKITMRNRMPASEFFTKATGQFRAKALAPGGRDAASLPLCIWKTWSYGWRTYGGKISITQEKWVAKQVQMSLAALESVVVVKAWRIT